MARVVITRPALDQLNALIATRALPAMARARVRASLVPLADFPMIGRRLAGRWTGHRLIIGPWPWLLIVYRYVEDNDLVRILEVHDARTAKAATAGPDRPAEDA